MGIYALFGQFILGHHFISAQTGRFLQRIAIILQAGKETHSWNQASEQCVESTGECVKPKLIMGMYALGSQFILFGHFISEQTGWFLQYIAIVMQSEKETLSLLPMANMSDRSLLCVIMGMYILFGRFITSSGQLYA